jgi:hypothetical protein
VACGIQQRVLRRRNPPKQTIRSRTTEPEALADILYNQLAPQAQKVARLTTLSATDYTPNSEPASVRCL